MCPSHLKDAKMSVGLERCSAVINVGHSCLGPESASQRLHRGSQPLVTPAPWNPTPLMRYRLSRLGARLGAAADRAPLLAKPIRKFQQESIAFSFHLLSRHQSKSSVSLAGAPGILALSEHSYPATQQSSINEPARFSGLWPQRLDFLLTHCFQAGSLPTLVFWFLFVCFPSQTPPQLSSGFF